MPTIIKRDGKYQARVRLAGHAPQSAIFDSKLKAAAWGHAVEAELRAQAGGTIKATLQAAIDKYITDVCPTHRSGANEAKRLRALCKLPGLLPVNRQMRDVTAVDISKFRDARLEQVSIATVRKEMGIIRSVFESARRDWGMVQANPCGDVKRPPAPPARKRLMLDDERVKILGALGWTDDLQKVEAMQHQVAVAMLLALETAMRAGEIVGLEWGRVYLSAQYLTLPKTKNGDQRDVPLSKTAVALLEKMRGADKTMVFTLSSAPAPVAPSRTTDTPACHRPPSSACRHRQSRCSARCRWRSARRARSAARSPPLPPARACPHNRSSRLSRRSTAHSSSALRSGRQDQACQSTECRFRRGKRGSSSRGASCYAWSATCTGLGCTSRRCAGPQPERQGRLVAAQQVVRPYSFHSWSTPALDGTAHLWHTAVKRITSVPRFVCARYESTVSLNSCGYLHFPQRPHSFCRNPALCCVSAHSCQAR
jgi:integrase